jgi:hypothetical protein
MLANLARFVVAGLTDHHMVRAELTATIPNVPTVPVQPIIEGNADLPTEFASGFAHCAASNTPPTHTREQMP